MDLSADNSLLAAIYRTVLYFQVFSYTPTLKEISIWLIAPVKPQAINTKQIQLAIESCPHLKIRKNRVSTTLNSKFINPSYQKSLNYQLKLDQAHKKIKFLKLIPTIKLIAISGSVAARAPQKNDDIDLLIVTQANYLWSTRLITILLSEVLRIRRRPNDTDINNKLCLNLFLDETSIKLDTNRRDIYTAHELLQIIPILNRDQIYEKLINQNQWTTSIYPNFPSVLSSSSNHPLKLKKIQSSMNLIEKISWLIQKKYMMKRQTIEKISPQSAFFHPFDYRHHVVNSYNNNLRLYNKIYYGQK